MSGDLVITVAPCGAETMRSHNPAVPYTPEEIAAEARRCYDAGFGPGSRPSHVAAWMARELVARLRGPERVTDP